VKRYRLEHKFIESAPEKLADGILYVSIKYETVMHLCCCGCGNEVVNPLDPAQWNVTFDGKTISLSPSVGNWSFPCQSHYWIRNNRVQWAPRFTQRQIARLRAGDRRVLEERYSPPNVYAEPQPEGQARTKPSFLARVRNWLRLRR